MTTRRFAYAAGGAAFGAAVAAGLFASFGQMFDQSTEYRLQVVVLDGPEAPGRAYKATSVIWIDRAATTQMRMPINGTEAYRVDVDMARQPGGTVYARFTICREMAASCVDIAKPALTAGKNEPASINSADNEGRSLMIGMYPADAQVPG